MPKISEESDEENSGRYTSRFGAIKDDMVTPIVDHIQYQQTVISEISNMKEKSLFQGIDME